MPKPANGIYSYGMRYVSRVREDPKQASKLFTTLFSISCVTNISDVYKRQGEGLKGAHPLRPGFFPVEPEAAEQAAEALAEFTDLNEFQADGKIDSGSAKQEEQDIIPQYLIHCVDGI